MSHQLPLVIGSDSKGSHEASKNKSRDQLHVSFVILNEHWGLFE